MLWGLHKNCLRKQILRVFIRNHLDEVILMNTRNICLYGEIYGKLSLNYHYIIPTPHQYAYFAQFDWLEKKFYTSIYAMSRNLGTIFLHRILKCAIMSRKIRF